MSRPLLLFLAVSTFPGAIASIGERFTLKDHLGRSVKHDRDANKVRFNSGESVTFFMAAARSDSTKNYDGTEYVALTTQSHFETKYMRHQNFVLKFELLQNYIGDTTHRNLAFDYAWKVVHVGGGKVKLYNDFGSGSYVGYDDVNDELLIVSTGGIEFSYDNSQCAYPNHGECGAGRWCEIGNLCHAKHVPGHVCLSDVECKSGSCCSGFCGGHEENHVCALDCACASGKCLGLCVTGECTYPNHNECSDGMWCDISGTCETKHDAGHMCTGNVECKSGTCCAGFCGGQPKDHFCTLNCACASGRCSWFTCQ